MFETPVIRRSSKDFAPITERRQNYQYTFTKRSLFLICDIFYLMRETILRASLYNSQSIFFFLVRKVGYLDVSNAVEYPASIGGAWFEDAI